MVMWMEDGSNGPSFHTLAWFGGRGHVRTYPRGGYDGRLDLGRDTPLPYFDNADEAAQFMWKNKGTPGLCQVDLSIVHELDYTPSEFDPDDLAHHGMKALRKQLVYV